MSENLLLTNENVLGLISENSPDLIALLDANGFFLYSNAAHLVRLGCNAESLESVTVSDLVHPDDAEAFRDTLQNAAKRRTVFNVSARWRKENGRSARFESLGKWISADGGKSQYLLLCSREVLPAKTEAATAEACADLRADAARLLAKAENEKNQVARAIHDTLGQKLTSASLELSLWKTELDGGHSKSVSAIREKIAVLSDLVNGLITCARGITATLRTRVLEEFGLVAALEWHVEKVQKETGVHCTFTTEREKLDVDAFMAAQIFHVAEQVVALRSHAGCKSLTVRLLTQDLAIALVFEDNGKDRRLTPEIVSRVRLLGGETEITQGTIAIALPTKSVRPLLD
jgi:PAS domain S-box-containing protein